MTTETIAEGPWAGFELISVYTRKQAIEDGVLVDLSTNFPSDTRLFKWPVACTSAVWAKIDKAAKKDRTEPGVYVWDVCNMAYMTIRSHHGDDPVMYFKVCLPLRENGIPITLKMVAGPIGPEDPSPCLTIMMPHED